MIPNKTIKIGDATWLFRRIPATAMTGSSVQALRQHRNGFFAEAHECATFRAAYFTACRTTLPLHRLAALWDQAVDRQAHSDLEAMQLDDCETCTCEQLHYADGCCDHCCPVRDCHNPYCGDEAPSVPDMYDDIPHPGGLW